MPTMRRLAETIKQARIQMGLSQEELAERLDVTPTHVKHLESGHRKPSVELLFLLVQVLHFSLDEIISPAEAEDGPLQGQVNSLLQCCSVQERLVIRDLLISMTNHLHGDTM